MAKHKQDPVFYVLSNIAWSESSKANTKSYDSFKLTTRSSDIGSSLSVGSVKTTI